MKLKRYVILLAGAAVLAASGSQARASVTLSVKDFGARGDGMTDDRPAIQAALNALQSYGGGVLTVPAGTYLLNSYQPSVHPWFFYNLMIGSNITVQGSTGTKFIQGPNGRAPMPSGATEVSNTVLAFGNSPAYVMNNFQDPAANGGFYPLFATTANSTTITLATPASASHFSVGDYVAIYATTTGDVIPSETSQVTSVNTATGVLGLKYALARSFASPYIANVTSLSTVNVGISNVGIQGPSLIAAIGTFNLTISNCQLTVDTNVTGNNVYGYNMNTIRGFTISNTVMNSTGPSLVKFELPQRNSQDGVLTGNTITAESVIFGEFAAHWNLTGNHIWVTPQPTSPASVAIGGLDVTFAKNDVHGGGTIPLIADYVGVDSYASYVGHISITGNDVECAVEISNCINLASVDPVVTNNKINVSGGGVAIKVQGPLPQSATIENNVITAHSFGVYLATPSVDNSVVIGNSMTGPGTTGIYVASASTPNSGGHKISANSVSGYSKAVDINLTMHPQTIVQDTVVNQCAADVSFQTVQKTTGVITPNAQQGTVTVTNNSGLPIAGPVYIALDNLRTGVSVSNSVGATSCTSPASSPVVVLGGGASWAPGQSLLAKLNFANAGKQPVTYTIRVLAGGTTR